MHPGRVEATDRQAEELAQANITNTSSSESEVSWADPPTAPRQRKLRRGNLQLAVGLSFLPITLTAAPTLDKPLDAAADTQSQSAYLINVTKNNPPAGFAITTNPSKTLACLLTMFS